jgi:uncharacterized protein YabE (DUF348 family)
MEWEEDHKVLRWVILVAIFAIIGLAIVAGLYGWYLYKTVGTSTDSQSATSMTDSTNAKDVLQSLTPKSDKSLLTPEEEVKIIASMSASSSAQVHSVTQATLDSLTPPR